MALTPLNTTGLSPALIAKFAGGVVLELFEDDALVSFGAVDLNEHELVAIRRLNGPGTYAVGLSDPSPPPNSMDRGAFERLNAKQRMLFVQGGGRLHD